MPQSYGNMNGTGSDMLFSDIYTEKVLLIKRDAGSLEENGEKIKQALSMNNAVGSVGGYYDDDLSILFMSDFFMKNLGYEYEEFMEAVGGSFKRLVYSPDLHYFELDNFRAGRGAGIFRIMMKDNTPVYVRTYKVESTDKNGVPIWIMSVRMSWDAQNLALVNGVIQSGVWYVDFNENSEVSGVTWSQRFRNMLGFSGPEDFPDNLDAWISRVHPQDRDRVLAEFYSAMLCGTVTFLGQTDSGEMLFCSGNGRHYFTVRSGWGVEGDCLYALALGGIRRDFKKAVTAEEIEFGVNNPQETKGTYSALARAMRREADKAILTVLRPVERGG